MKIAVIRGRNMTRFEMQGYEPLMAGHTVTGYASKANNYDLSGIRFPVKRLHTIDEYYDFLPGPGRSLVHGMLLPFGANAKMIGLEKELKNEDIYHSVETFNGFSYQAARCREKYGKKLVLTIWENIPFASVRNFKGLTNNEPAIRYVIEHTDAFIAITERARDALVIEGAPEDRIHVIPAGIDLSRFRPADPDPAIAGSLGLDDRTFTILFVGRMTREKGIYPLLYAAKLAQSDRDLSHVRFIMAGEGPETAEVAHLIRRLGIQDTVKLVGGFSYSQMPDIYNSVDAFVLPSIPRPGWQEQFGMVLVEAMASGLPVISTLSGSIPEVVGDGGSLVQADDPRALYLEIKRLALDEAYRKQLSLKGRERVLREFDICRTSKMMEAVYKKIA